MRLDGEDSDDESGASSIIDISRLIGDQAHPSLQRSPGGETAEERKVEEGNPGELFPLEVNGDSRDDAKHLSERTQTAPTIPTGSRTNQSELKNADDNFEEEKNSDCGSPGLQGDSKRVKPLGVAIAPTETSGAPKLASNPPMIRIVMGDSVLKWRQSGQKPKSDHVLIRASDIIHKQINWSESQLELSQNSRSARLSCRKIISSDKNILEQSTYTGSKRIKDSSTQNFCECIAMWNNAKQCYVLELVETVVTDLVPDATLSNATSLDNSAAPASKKKDPLAELRQAEQQVVQSRKKKKRSASTKLQQRHVRPRSK